jgi:AcrR family transcriptional regulator
VSSKSDVVAVTQSPDTDIESVDNEAVTKNLVFVAAERLFALHGFQNVSVRDITAAAGVNLASVNYHFGSKDALLYEIFRRRTVELNRERAKKLHEATDRHAGSPPVREILAALLTPPLKWLAPDHERRISLQFLIRARSEGTDEIRKVLQTDVTHLRRFSDALLKARPDLPPEEIYWRLHFTLGMLHNNRFAEFDRLNVLSENTTSEADVEALLTRMLAFAEAGFAA